MGFAIGRRLNGGRESFSPDAAYYVGAFPLDDSKFIDGPPTFAVEVRSPDDSGPVAESNMTEKRSEYFEAGTQVVWDVDPVSEEVRMYRPDSQDHPVIFRRGDIADAEPAVTGWRMPVDDNLADVPEWMACLPPNTAPGSRRPSSSRSPITR